jgi:transposase
MLPEGLLPKIPGLSLEKIKLESNILKLVTTIRTKSSFCSVCGHKSSRIHSCYVRRLSDLPWAGIKTTLFLKVHKFFCDNPECSRKIFTQRLEGLKAYARRTTRESSQLVSIGMAIGGNGGSRLAMKLGMIVSASTVLRLIHAQSTVWNNPPRVLGIDDWAMRKGQVYGTILADLEKHKAIDLLPDRESETLEKWLKNHPGIEIISRDRAGNYAEGATKGAPQAIQVADRWHLLKNLTEALKRIMEKHQQLNRQVALEIAKKIQ